MGDKQKKNYKNLEKYIYFYEKFQKKFLTKISGKIFKGNKFREYLEIKI